MGFRDALHRLNVGRFEALAEQRRDEECQRRGAQGRLPALSEDERYEIDNKTRAEWAARKGR